MKDHSYFLIYASFHANDLSILEVRLTIAYLRVQVPNMQNGECVVLVRVAGAEDVRGIKALKVMAEMEEGTLKVIFLAGGHQGGGRAGGEFDRGAV